MQSEREGPSFILLHMESSSFSSDIGWKSPGLLWCILCHLCDKAGGCGCMGLYQGRLFHSIGLHDMLLFLRQFLKHNNISYGENYSFFSLRTAWLNFLDTGKMCYKDNRGYYKTRLIGHTRIDCLNGCHVQRKIFKKKILGSQGMWNQGLYGDFLSLLPNFVYKPKNTL